MCGLGSLVDLCEQLPAVKMLFVVLVIYSSGQASVPLLEQVNDKEPGGAAVEGNGNDDGCWRG